MFGDSLNFLLLIFVWAGSYLLRPGIVVALHSHRAVGKSFIARLGWNLRCGVALLVFLRAAIDVVDLARIFEDRVCLFKNRSNPLRQAAGNVEG